MPDVIDPSGFQIAVVVRTGGGVFPLWFNGAVQGESTIFHGIDSDDVLYRDLPIVESVEVDIGMGLIGKVSIEVAATYDLGLELLNSSLFAIGTVIDVQIGYPRVGKFLPWFSTMASKPSININPDDGLTATLNGEGGAFAAERGESSQTFNGPYLSEPGVSPSQQGIIQQIANQESNLWNLDVPTRNGRDDPLYIDRGEVSQGNRNDWMFVMHMCRLANCDAYIRPDPNTQGANLLRVARRSEAMGDTPRYKFVSRGQVNFIDTFPILEFESSAEGVWLPPRQTSVADIHMRSRESEERTVRPEDTDVPILPGDATPGAGAEEEDGTVVAVEPVPRDDRGTGRRIVVPERAPERQEDVLNMVTTEARQRGGLNASFSAFGLTDLFPGEVVRLEGLGIFSGNYGIESINHSAAPGEWSMNVKLLGDGLDGERLATALTQEWDRFNNENVEEQAEATGGGTIEVDPVDVSAEEFDPLSVAGDI